MSHSSSGQPSSGMAVACPQAHFKSQNGWGVVWGSEHKAAQLLVTTQRAPADPGSVPTSPPHSRSHFAQPSSSRTDLESPQGHQKGHWDRQLNPLTDHSRAPQNHPAPAECLHVPKQPLPPTDRQKHRDRTEQITV